MVLAQANSFILSGERGPSHFSFASTSKAGRPLEPLESLALFSHLHPRYTKFHI